MRRTATFMIAVMLAAGLTGCTPDGGQETPSPEPTVSTPAPTPTPQWTEEEQAAIDAVQNYLAVWTYISQNLQTADWNAIRDVASDPAANDAGTLWRQWYDNDWHLVGSPSFEVARVAEGGTDYQGTQYHVYGCYITANSHLSDADGNPLTKQGPDRGTANVLVLHMLTPTDRYLVLQDTTEGDPC